MTNKRPRLGEDFPRQETFTDCCGTEREFVIEVTRGLGGRYLLTDREQNGKPDGYEFATSSTTDPYSALGQLRLKIRKGLSIRYLTFEHGKRSPSHDELKGRISSKGIVVDGEFVSFEEFARMGKGVASLLLPFQHNMFNSRALIDGPELFDRRPKTWQAQ